MRGLRSTIALVVVLAGLGAYIYFVTWKTAGAAATPRRSRTRCSPALEADKIEELKVTSAAGDVDDAEERQRRRGRSTQPIAATAAESEVSGHHHRRSASSRSSRVIDENPANLNDYGLVERRASRSTSRRPATRTTASCSSARRRRPAAISSRSGTTRSKVFLIPAFQETTFNKSTFDLRDKTVLKFERDKVDGIDVDAGGKTLELAKDGGDWKITKPVADARPTSDRSKG